MSTVEELKNFLRSNNVTGYSNKNKAQLIQMVEEYKNSEPLISKTLESKRPKIEVFTHELNFLSILPTDIKSNIGTYLNYANTIKTSNLNKDSSLYILSRFQKCATVNIPADYTNQDEYVIYLEKIVYNLEILFDTTPNLQFLKLYFKIEYNTEKPPEIDDLLIILKKFTKLSGLEIISENYYSIDSKTISILNEMKLQYLFLNLSELPKIILKKYLELPNLIYLKIDANIFNTLQGAYVHIGSNVDTLDLVDNGDIVNSFYIDDVRLFKNMRRFIINNFSYQLLRRLQNMKNLEVLEFDSSEHILFELVFQEFPMTIKYLRISFGDIKLLSDVINTIIIKHIEEGLQYVVIPEDISAIMFIDILNSLQGYKLKYLYVKSIDFNISNIDKYWLHIKQILNQTGTKVIFEKIYYQGKFIKLEELWNVAVSKDQSFYTLVNTEYYSPNQWLTDHGYLLKPECD